MKLIREFVSRNLKIDRTDMKLKGLGKKHWFKVIIGIALLIIFFKWIDIFSSVEYIKTINLLFVPVFMILVVFIHFVKALRFRIMSSAMDININFRRNLLIHFVVPVIGLVTPAKLGEATKVILLKGDKKRLGFCFILEKIGDFFFLFLFSLFFVIHIKKYVGEYLIIGTLLVVGLIILMNSNRVLKFFLGRDILGDDWFRKLIRKFSVYQWLLFILSTVVIWMINFVVISLITISLGIQVDFFALSQIFAISVLIGFFSGIPGGFGTRELSFTFLLTQYLLIPTGMAGIIALMHILVIPGTVVILSVVALVLMKLLKELD